MGDIEMEALVEMAMAEAMVVKREYSEYWGIRINNTESEWEVVDRISTDTAAQNSTAAAVTTHTTTGPPTEKCRHQRIRGKV